MVNALNQTINQGLADANIKKRVADLGDALLVTSPAEFAKLVADETDKWRKVIVVASIKAE